MCLFQIDVVHVTVAGKMPGSDNIVETQNLRAIAGRIFQLICKFILTEQQRLINWQSNEVYSEFKTFTSTQAW